MLVFFHRAPLSPNLCGCCYSCVFGRAEVIDGRPLIYETLLKNSSSEQGDLGSASNLGNQHCSGKEVLISGDKNSFPTCLQAIQWFAGGVSNSSASPCRHGESLAWCFASRSHQVFVLRNPLKALWSMERVQENTLVFIPPFRKKTRLESQLKLQSFSGMYSKSTQLRLRYRDR